MNNINAKQVIDYAQLILQLAFYCKEKRSGTMLIISSDNHSIRFVLNDGVIIACAYTMTQGKDALVLVRGIKSGSFSFVDGGFTGGMNINESPLPSTREIFQILGLKSQSQTLSTEKVVSLIQKDHLIEVEKELSKYVGPMAEFICEEYIEDFGSPASSSDFSRMVNYIITNEIDDPIGQEKFKQSAMNIISNPSA